MTVDSQSDIVVDVNALREEVKKISIAGSRSIRTASTTSILAAISPSISDTMTTS